MILDHSLHVGGGALLAVPLIASGFSSPVVVFCVFSIWGLLREQAQRHVRGAGFERNWIGIWNWNKLTEGLAWGVGGAAASLLP